MKQKDDTEKENFAPDSGPFPIDVRLTCARYGKRTMGIGEPGGEGLWFFKTEGRDLDSHDVAVLHRFIYLWNSHLGQPTEQFMPKLEAKS